MSRSRLTNFAPESPHVPQQVPCALQHTSLFCPWPRASLLSAIDGQDPPRRCRLPKTLRRRSANAARPRDSLLPRSATRARHQQCDITFVLNGEHDVSWSSVSAGIGPEDLFNLPHPPFHPAAPHHKTPRGPSLWQPAARAHKFGKGNRERGSSSPHALPLRTTPSAA